MSKRQAAAAAAAAKHRALLGSATGGRVLSALMLPLLRLSPSRGYGVLTTTGRKTGKPRSKCVRIVAHGDRAYLVALVPPQTAIAQPDAVNAWVRNIRANPKVRLRILGGAFDGVAREITDPAELAQAKSALCDAVFALDYWECALHLRGLPTRTKVQHLHRYWFETGIPVAIDLKENRP